MSIDWKLLQAKIQKLEQTKARAEGAKAQLLKDLKSDFQMESLADAKKLLKKLLKEESDLEDNFKEAMSDFLDQWPMLQKD